MNDAVFNIQVRVISQGALSQLNAINRAINQFQNKSLGSGVTSTSGIDNAISKISSAISTVEKFGQRLQTAGRQLTNTFTIPIVLAGAAAVHFALENETAGTQLSRVYQGPVKDIALLRQGFEALSSLYGIQQADIINIGTAWAKAGAQGSALLKVTQLTAQVMLLSGQSADEAATSVIALRQQWGLSVAGMQKAVATLNLISDTTNVSLGDLFDSMTKGAGTARTTGVDIEHYAAMVASLVPATGSATNSGTVLSRILEKLFVPTKQSADLMKMFGINVLDASYQSLNGSQRLELLATKFKGLNEAQKSLIVTTAASKIQVNSLDTLLDAINDPLSAYNKTLHNTADGSAAMARMTKDLNTVLASNPQRFQIIKTQLENALSDAIMPMLPALLELVEMVKNVAQWFSNLSPATQKTIIVWLGFLAVVGPIVRVLGGLIVVLGGLGKALLLPIKAAVALGEALFGIGGGALSGLAAFFAAAPEEAAASGAASGIAFGAAFDAGLAGASLAEAALAGMAAIPVEAAVVGATSGGLLAAAFAAAVAVGPELVVVGIVALLVIFRNQINDAISGVVTALAKLPGLVGQVLLGVLRTVISIGKAIWQALQDFLNPFQRHSPSLVDLVVAGVDVISAKYKSLGNLGTAFRNAVGDIKAFNGAMKDVIAGQRAIEDAKAVKAISTQGGSAAGNAASRGFAIQGVLYQDLDKVTAAYGRQEVVVDKLNRRLTESQRILDAEQTKLNALQAVADGFSSRLNDAQAALDKWSSTPLVGQQKMSNAIFDNGIAIDKLQLKLDKLSDAKGNLDDIRGQLELLTGERNALRLKGAGSDVLAPFNDQINSITGQGSGLSDAVAEMTKLEQAISDLQKKGDELNLEQSIEFDPLTRKIQQAATAMKEMPFDRVITGVEFEKRKVDALTTSYQNANDRVKAQTIVVKNQQVATDKINAVYQVQNDKLSALGDTYDTINSMIQAIDSTFKNAASSAGDFNAALAGAAGAGGDLTAPTLTPLKGLDLDKMVKDLQKQVKKSFGKVDFGDIFTKPFKDAWDKFKGWWRANPQTFFDHTNIHMPSISFEGFKSNWHTFQDWWTTTAWPFISGLPGTIVGAFKNLASDFWAGLKGVGEAIIAPFVWAYDKLLGHSIIPDIVNGIENWFKKLPGKIVRAIGNVGRELYQWGEGLLVNVFAGISQVWNQYIAPFFANTWDRISRVVTGTGSKLFTWGHNLLNDAWNGIQFVWNNVIKPFFSSIKDSVMGAIGDAGSWLYNTGKDMLTGFLRGAQDVAKKIPGVGVIESLPIIGPVVKSVLGFKLASGGVAQPVPGGISARIAEAGRPELVAPLPNGFSMGRLAATIDRVDRFVTKGGDSIAMKPVATTTHNHFSGDLVFPNVTDGDDAEAFMRNLESIS